MLRGILLVILFITTVTAQQCGTVDECSDCTAIPGCGWCVQQGVARCIAGGATGPSECRVWQHDHSQEISSTTGFPVHPAEFEVYLKPGEPLNLRVQVTPLENNNAQLDMVLVQDASASMNDDLVNVRKLIPSLVNNMIAYKDDTYFGFASFIDKPLQPMGVSDRFGDGTAKNYPYKLHYPLSNEFNGLLSTVATITTQGNRDFPESSLDAMAYTMICNNTGWRPNSMKVMVVLTDATWHEEGDSAAKRPYSTSNCSPPYDNCCFSDPSAGNNRNMYPGGTCPFSLPVNDYNCVFDAYDKTGANVALSLPGTGEDYVSRHWVKQSLTTNNILPIFCVTDTSATPANETQVWEEFRDFFGFGNVHQLTADSSNLVPAITSSLEKLSRQVKMAVAIDDYGYVQNWSPREYLDIDITQVVNFNVTLYSASTVRNSTIQLTVFGFGKVFINVLGTLPCDGCDGIPDSNAFFDACGVCNGTDACADCDGVPYGSKVPDVCDVCGGGGTTCLGCDGVAKSGKEYDQCGICGGNNDCVGCDGVPRFPPYVYDQCGVCGGNNTCLDCFFTPFGNVTVDRCGVCGGTDQCLGCDGAYRYPPLRYDTCGVCGGIDNTCFDCKGVPGGPAKLDNCSVCDGNNTCQGCDGAFNPLNKAVYDQCGICGGDGRSCQGCDGVPNSGLVFDACGICGGTNSCIGCDGIPNSGAVLDVCDVCNGNSSCIGCDLTPHSGKIWDKCNVCGGNNDCLGCDGTPYSGKIYDICHVCGGNGKSCLGCDGIAFSNKTMDVCGLCGGTDSCVGCDEIAFSGKIFDRCGVCGGNDGCIGCDGKINSGLVIDRCGVCPNVINYVVDACVGCDNETYSGLVNDNCGVCGGTDDCLGCDGIPFSNKTLDLCGVCPDVSGYIINGCLGCDGVAYSNKAYDRCGVCGGNNTCVGCDNIPNSGATRDLCGVCNPATANETAINVCLGCDGVPFSGLTIDICDECGGNGTSCRSGCDFLPYSTKEYDICGVCGGDNRTCAKVDLNETYVPPIIPSAQEEPWYLQPRTITIAASVIGSVIVGAVALVAGFFIYKRLRGGADWYIPAELRDEAGFMVTENPLFQSSGSGFQENILFENLGADD